jgi:hypothetical protein
MITKISTLFTLFILTFSLTLSAADIKKKDAKLKKEVLKVLDKNETLHAAFFKYDGVSVEKNAKLVISEINNITHKEFIKLLAFSKARLQSITAKRDREENNKSYHMFSMALIYIMNTYDLGEKYHGYRCPTVRKQWVQNVKKQTKVHNPYAPSMPHCGEQIKL